MSFLGRELIDIVNRLPMWLDLSHCGHRTRAEAVVLARAPVCTHSNAYGLNPNDPADALLDSDDDGYPDSEEAGDADLDTYPLNSDDDNISDWRDPDSDNDGVDDLTDNCRLIPNAQQEDLDDQLSDHERVERHAHQGDRKSVV